MGKKKTKGKKQIRGAKEEFYRGENTVLRGKPFGQKGVGGKGIKKKKSRAGDTRKRKGILGERDILC